VQTVDDTYKGVNSAGVGCPFQVLDAGHAGEMKTTEKSNSFF